MAVARIDCRGLEIIIPPFSKSVYLAIWNCHFPSTFKEKLFSVTPKRFLILLQLLLQCREVHIGGQRCFVLWVFFKQNFYCEMFTSDKLSIS